MNAIHLKKNLTALILIITTSSALAQAQKAEAEIDNIMKELDVIGLPIAVVKRL